MLENEHWNQWEMIPFMDQQAAIAKSRLLFLPFLLFFHLCFDAFNPVAHLISGDWLVTRLYGKHTSEWEMVRRTFFQLMFPSKHSILTTLQQHLFVVWACLNWTTQVHRAVGVPSQEAPMPMDTLLEAASPHLWGAVGCVCAPNPTLCDSTATRNRALTSLQHGVVEGWQGQLLCPAGLTEVGAQPGCALLQRLRHGGRSATQLTVHWSLRPAGTEMSGCQWQKQTFVLFMISKTFNSQAQTPKLSFPLMKARRVVRAVTRLHLRHLLMCHGDVRSFRPVRRK